MFLLVAYNIFFGIEKKKIVRYEQQQAEGYGQMKMPLSCRRKQPEEAPWHMLG
jgi:hypothetical protein